MQKRSDTIAELVGKLKNMPRDHYEYLEVKQMAEILARHRTRAREVLADYRRLKTAMRDENDAIEKLYLNYEGMFLRDHLRDALRLYVMVNHDFHDAWRSYMDGLKSDNSQAEQPGFDAAPIKKIIPSNGVTKMSHQRRSAA